MLEKKDIFISYGRKESKAFARKLHDSLVESGYTVWLDMINIPAGDDYQQRIDNGIESADNFLFVISPHALQSEFCLKEILHAEAYNKRIFPILHVEAEKDDPVWGKMHPNIRKTHWISLREQADISLPLENWQPIDDYAKGLNDLKLAIETQKSYVDQHTKLLLRALEWKKKRQKTKYLLVGDRRHEAQNWLLKEFKAPEQPPCLPTDLHAEYICDSKKNAENLMTNMFISHPTGNVEIREKVEKSLARNGITTWTHLRDIQSGEDAEQATLTGIEQADNFLFFISKESIVSENCLRELNYAFQLNKRIIPLLIEEVAANEFPDLLKGLSCIDFTNNVALDDFEKDIDQILKVINEDGRYFEKHKILLAQALKWQRQKHNTSILLRGFNLQNAKVWLGQGKQKGKYAPTDLHEEFIKASEAHDGEMDIEVFIAYSRKDGDFARKLNAELELNGKTTWFDQDSIAEGADFEEEIKKGIASADNFLFIISPDSVNSSYCIEEVAYAEKLGKRFINVMVRPTDASLLPEALSKVQWVNFEHENADFQAAFNQLMRTLNIDREHVQSHKKWQQKAMDWQEQVKKSGDENSAKELLLGEVESVQAEAWLLDTKSAKKDPPPTSLQEKFIALSKETVQAIRQKEKQIEETLRKRLRIVRIALVAAFVLLLVAVASFGIAEYNRQIARENEIKAAKSASEAKSLLLTNTAVGLLVSENNPTKAMSVALEAYDLVKTDPPKPILDALDNFLNIQNFKNLKHARRVNYSAFVPNHNLVLTCSDDNTAKLWKTDGSLVKTLDGHQDLVDTAVFSQDGNFIVTCSRDKKAILWSDEGFFITSLAGHSDRVTGASFSNDGSSLVTWSRDGTARVWEINGRRSRLVKVLDGEGGAVIEANISPDGGFIYTLTENGTGKLWRSNGVFLSTLELGNGYNPVNFAKFSPKPNDPWLFIASSNGNAKIYDLATGYKRIFNLGFEPKRIAPASRSFFNTINITDTVKLDTVGLHSHAIADVKLSPDGSLLLTRSDNEAKLWNMNELLAGIGPRMAIQSMPDDMKNKQILLADLSFLDGSNIDFIKFSEHAAPDSLRILTANQNGKARLWRYNGNLLCDANFSGYSRPLRLFEFSPNGNQLLTASSSGRVKLWEIGDNPAGDGRAVNFKADLSGHLLGINSLDFSPNGNLMLTSSADQTAKIWELQPNPFKGGHHPEAISQWRIEHPTPPLTPEDRVAFDLLEPIEEVITMRDTVRFRVYGDYFANIQRLSDAKLLYENYESIAHSPRVFTSLAEVNWQLGKDYKLEPFAAAEVAEELKVYARFFKTEADSLKAIQRPNDAMKLYGFSEELYKKLHTKEQTAQTTIELADVRFSLSKEIDLDIFDSDDPAEIEMYALFLSQRWSSLPWAKRIPAYEASAKLYRKLLRINRKAGADIAKNKRDLANVYNSLAYYYLFDQKFEKAEKAALLGLRADDTYPWTNTKLALAYLYQGKYDQAEEVFRTYKGQAYGKDNYTERFLGYMDNLEKAGIYNEAVEQARAFLKS
ncbi:TIR domain-containing protein [Flammeovirgaceae bacterium SG7u.111]|nr:TIR domain-containing protein [Flammeovirgaceae bacterium SG7u.132]WPO37522.1 TIR domain-containing protein [Flammeovirgaceae bacterium SG7u.111]